MLDQRKAAILRAIVEEYIQTAEPVGSARVIGATEMSVSPATIRSEMSRLEDEGFLRKPHTSAGRVPTDKGYRFFVDELGAEPQLSVEKAQRIGQFFEHAHTEMERTMRSVSSLLADLTSAAAVVVSDSPPDATVRSAQLVALSDRVALAVLVMSNGQIVKCNVDHTADVSDDQVGRASLALHAALVGKPVGSALDVVGLDSTVAQLVESAQHSLVATFASEHSNVYVDGASHIVPAFSASETLRDVLGMLEQHLMVVQLMKDMVDQNLRVAIGAETGIESLSECSVVVARVRAAGAVAGTVAVLGPSRMDYRQTVAAVSTVSDLLGHALTTNG